jgi:methionine synthase I (cobalamin-dependent)
MTFDTKAHSMGITPEQALESLSSLGMLALGGNCNVAGRDRVISRMHAANPQVTLVCQRGATEIVDGAVVCRATPQVMADYAQGS